LRGRGWDRRVWTVRPSGGYNKRMVSLQIDQSPGSWDAILRHLERGEAVQLLRGQHVVGVVHPPEDLAQWPAVSAQQLARVLKPEDFSDWNPPHAAR